MRWHACDGGVIADFILFGVGEKAQGASSYMSISPRILDRIEQVLLLGALLWFFGQVWPSFLDFQDQFLGSLRAVLLVISEAAIILFMVFRKPTGDISIRAYDWFIAIGATIGPLFVRVEGEPLWLLGGVVIQLAGIFIHLGAKLSLNFSFGIVAANRGVRQNGLYRFVRHPMYFGYVVAHTGFFLTSPTLWNGVVYAAVWTLLVLRIFAEERVLSQDEKYRALKEKTRYRLVPGVF